MAALATSRHRNVYWHGRSKKWAACVKVGGRNHHIGSFDDEDEAARHVEAYYARQRTDWPARVVESLCQFKREGRSFTAAWKIALRDNPPQARDIGRSDGTLFDERGVAEESIHDAFWRFCEMEYTGRLTTRLRFSFELFSPMDWSRPASRPSRSGLKAAA